jgi:EAL domain-containing protein (putative c-di-GMP-specific phosphodiesterase class I)/GGDEF domain-containing protein
MIDNKHLKKFIKNLHNITDSKELVLQSISDELQNFAEEIKLGHLEVTLDFNAPTAENQNVTHSVVLYTNSNGFEKDSLKQNFLSANSNSIKIYANPVKNSSWNEEEKSDIQFIFQTIFILLERVHFFTTLMSFQEIDFFTGAKNLQGLHSIGDNLFEKDELKDYTTIFLNIKNLRFYNLLYGEKNGNYILRVYSMMSQNFIGSNGFFAHLGGDNFVSLIKTDFVKEYLKFISKVVIPIDANGVMQNVNINVRAGIAPIQSGTSFPIALSNASFALRIAKESVQNDFVWFEKEVSQQFFISQKISNSFQKALSNNEIQVLYQPIVNLNTKTIVGAEAVSRWQSDKLYLPKEYLPHLEADGLTHILDLFVLEKICIDIKTWEQKRIPIYPISFNLSAFDLYHEDFEDKIIKIVSGYNVNPEFIEIEIPEIHDPKLIMRLGKFINTVSEFGIKVCLDKFGTKTSSLSLLNSFHFDTLKMNQDVLNSLLSKNKVNIIFTKALLSITKELNIKVVALGVENSEHLLPLKKLGCKFGQGFYFERPLYHIEFENLLLQEKRFY